MKTITLTQPFATLVAIGAKRIETRSWRTDYRGPLAIHAAAGLGPVGGRAGLSDLCDRAPFKQVLDPLWSPGTFWAPESLPFGAIVATCTLVGIIKIESFEDSATQYYPYPRGWTLTAQERAFGDFAPGRYAWLLADMQCLATPIAARGALGLWEWTATMKEDTP